MTALSGLGSLATGLRQGVEFGQDVQLRRQRKKALDYTLNQMGRDDAAAQANSQDITDEEREFYGGDLSSAFMPEVGEDPFLYRLMDMWGKRKLGGRRKKAVAGTPGDIGMPVATAAPTDVATTTPYLDPNEGVEMYADGGYTGYKDGGSVRQSPTISDDGLDEEDIKKRAAANRANKPGSVQNATESVAGKNKFRADKLMRGAGRIAGGGAALAGMAGAMQGARTPTEDYAERMGLDPSSVGLSFWRDAGIRGAGVMTDVGAAAGNMVGMDLRSRFADVQRQQAAPGAAALEAPRTQAIPMGETAQASMSVTGGRRAAAPAAAPARPQAGDAIDMSKVDIDASELPDIKMSDWKRYRAQALRTARMRGLPQAEALEQADRMVTTMQIRGFSNYASQAQALLQVGNVKAALRSLRAAYQYFPDGNDVKLGVHNGKIVAVGIDEATGEPFEGGTRVITPEFLAGAVQNFSNPQNFLSWTQDWRQEAFKERQYNEVTKPLAEAQGQALRTNADANVARSEAAQLRAAMSGGAGGMRPSDMRGSEAVYRERLSLLGVTDEAEADQLAAVMSQIKVANPQVPDNMIVDFVMKAQQRPDGAQFIQRALSGQ